jgi:hypothetical protein
LTGERKILPDIEFFVIKLTEWRESTAANEKTPITAKVTQTEKK